MSVRSVPAPAGRIPLWVWGLALAIAAIAPAQHIWFRYFPPVGSSPTGLHIPDDAIFLQAMRMFENGFYSPYATCKAATASGPGYFALPYLWLYGMLGAAGRLVGLNDFITLGIANGFGGLVYLLVVYGCLREIVPRYASRAFVLFVLGGGLGGVAYALAALTGVTTGPMFEAYFRRFALYELLEGPYLSPVTLLPRVYYTVSLAFGLGGFTILVRAWKGGGRRRFAWALLLLGVASLINLRVGAFVSAVAVLYFLCALELGRAWLKMTAWILVPFVLVGPVVLGVTHMSPVMTANLKYSAAMAMWLSPFLSAAILLLIPAGYQLWRRLPALPRVPRALALSLVGYLAAFLALFAAYQVYYGNVLICRDGVVAIAISDWALLGALVGLPALFRRGGAAGATPEGWVELWFLGFVAGSVSAFGHGWFLRFGPQRLMVLIALPLAILAAQGLESITKRRPRFARGWMTLIVACGVVSTVVSALYFQGPLGWRPNGPFAWAMPGLMTPADRSALEHIPSGTVLAPPEASDTLALQDHHRVLAGTGMFNLTEQPYGAMSGAVERFFSARADDRYRRDFVNEWCVDYVFCPDTWRVSPEVVDRLRRTPWLRETYAKGHAALFAVMRDQPTGEPRNGR